MNYYTNLFCALCLLFTLGCSKSPDRAIEDVLNQCAELSGEVNTLQLPAPMAADYLVSGMQKIDTRDCPPEFREAFQGHINAWHNAASHFANNTALNSVLEGFYSGFTGDLSMFGQSNYAASQAAEYISITYYQLTEIASYYGARIPRSEIN